MSTNQITTIYVVRHGQSLGNINQTKQNMHGVSLSEFGELQSPLSGLGRKQATGLAHKLAGVSFDAFFTSDLNRARETAEIIAEKHGKKVITESTIRERYWGNGTKGFTKKQRLEIEKGLADLNDEEKLRFRYFPDGETALEAVNRFKSFLNKIIPQFINKTILVVNHGNIMRSFLIHIGWARYNELPPGSIDNAGYFILLSNGKKFKVIDAYGIHKSSVKNDYEE